MRAILVCVDFADILALTLPYNRHHFSDVMVVTHPLDQETIRVAAANRCCWFTTDAFYRDGAVFNKWLALEEGLDVFGRRGWLCIMDADVLWPKKTMFLDSGDRLTIGRGDVRMDWADLVLHVGSLCTPRRRMDMEFHRETHLPPEDRWADYPLHPQQREFAGYSQIFHADDPHLGPAPWHQTDWIHAGGADSFFQAKWPEANKVRPPFEVLHLGPAGQNWFGRATPRLDGTLPEGAEERRDWSGRRIWEQRRQNQAEGRDRFCGERIEKAPPTR